MGVRLEKVSKDGLATLTFNVSLFKHEYGRDQFNNQSISIKLLKAYTDLAYDVPWKVENISASKL